MALSPGSSGPDLFNVFSTTQLLRWKAGNRAWEWDYYCRWRSNFSIIIIGITLFSSRPSDSIRGSDILWRDKAPGRNQSGIHGICKCYNFNCCMPFIMSERVHSTTHVSCFLLFLFTQAAFNITENMDGSATSYIIEYFDEDSTRMCGFDTIEPSVSCKNGLCTHFFDISSSNCNSLRPISVTVSAENRLGRGAPSTPILIRGAYMYIIIHIVIVGD